MSVAQHTQGGSFVLGLLIAVLLAGCGSSSSSSKSKSSASASSPPTAAPFSGTTASVSPSTSTATSSQSATSPAAKPSPSVVAADKRAARDAQLRLTDFPSGWQEADKSSSSRAPCGSIEEAKKAASTRDKSHSFSKNNGNTNAGSAAYIYADVATATRWFARLSDSATRKCIGDALGKDLAKADVKVGEVTTGALAIEPAGDERAAGRLKIPLTARGAKVQASVDLIFARVGRGVSILTLTDVLTSFDSALASQLTKDVVNRLNAGLKKSS